MSVCLSSMCSQSVAANCIFINVRSLVSLKALQCLSVLGLLLCKKRNLFAVQVVDLSIMQTVN